MQDVAPAPPAQIILSVMLLPQWFLHWLLASRGRAACCSLLGVLGAVGETAFRPSGADLTLVLNGGLTVVAGQTPAAGDTFEARGEVVGGLGQADGGHGGAEAGGRGQLDEGDVIVDGAGVPAGVGEHLGEEGSG